MFKYGKVLQVLENLCTDRFLNPFAMDTDMKVHDGGKKWIYDVSAGQSGDRTDAV